MKVPATFILLCICGRFHPRIDNGLADSDLLKQGFWVIILDWSEQTQHAQMSTPHVWSEQHSTDVNTHAWCEQHSTDVDSVQIPQMLRLSNYRAQIMNTQSLSNRAQTMHMHSVLKCPWTLMVGALQPKGHFLLGSTVASLRNITPSGVCV